MSTTIAKNVTLIKNDMTTSELTKLMFDKTPILIKNSWTFALEPTFIKEVKENPILGNMVKVDRSDQYYEGFRIRIA